MDKIIDEIMYNIYSYVTTTIVETANCGRIPGLKQGLKCRFLRGTQVIFLGPWNDQHYPRTGSGWDFDLSRMTASSIEPGENGSVVFS